MPLAYNFFDTIQVRIMPKKHQTLHPFGIVSASINSVSCPVNSLLASAWDMCWLLPGTKALCSNTFPMSNLLSSPNINAAHHLTDQWAFISKMF
jgi:hypothetical protein